MKKIIIISFLLCISIHMSVFAQNIDRTPSYNDPSWYISDHPSEDVNVYMFFNSWRNSEVQNGYGGFHVQTIVTDIIIVRFLSPKLPTLLQLRPLFRSAVPTKIRHVHIQTELAVPTRRAHVR